MLALETNVYWIIDIVAFHEIEFLFISFSVVFSKIAVVGKFSFFLLGTGAGTPYRK